MIKQPDFHDFTALADSLRDEPTSQPPAGGARPMDLAKVFEYIRRRIRLIIECILIGGGLSAASGLLVGPTFTATALLAVAEPDQPGQSQATDSAVDTQIAMLQSQVFLERAFRVLTADPALKPVAPSVSAIERRMKVLQASKSRLIAVSFSAKSADLAADAVNKIVRLYVEDPALQSVAGVDDVTEQYLTHIKTLESQLSELTKADADPASGAKPGANLAAEEALRDKIASLKLDENLVRRRQESRRQTLAMAPPVQLIAPADPPRRRSSLNPLLIAAPGTLFSALFGIGLAVTIGRLDKRIYTREQLEALARSRCAGEIPSTTWTAGKRRSVGVTDPAYVRAIEAVVTQSVLLPTPRPRFVLMAPSEADPEASRIVADFAAAAARVVPRVLLIDLDFSRLAPRQPLIQRLLRRAGDETRRDVFDVLAGRSRFQDVVEAKNGDGYFQLPLASPVVDDPFSLLASGRLGELLDALSDNFDLIVVAGPPMSGVHEAQIIATFVEAAVLLVRSGVTKEPAVLAACTAGSQSLGLSSLSGRARLWPVLVEAPPGSHPPGLLLIAANLARRAATRKTERPEAAPVRNPPQPNASAAARVEGSVS